ncbi:hypothetical protein [Haloplanus natans]|uniref:hypothetical protein n=1 Tax=Haloplanus natans TaxID=376171 RepID=UPI0006775B68|nr:hypothetical protein [Haloplanus natans]
MLTPAVVYVPAGSLAQAGNDGIVGNDAPVGNDGIVGNDAPIRPETPLPPVVGARRPTDPNGDGRFEDVNGDGTFDVVDSQALLAHLPNESVRNHTVRYDFTADGVADVSDVQWLYVRAIQPSSADPDGDGLNNSREIELGTNAFAVDTDDDGLADPVEANDGSAVDTDGDGTIDARDRDSDGDGATDAREGDADTDGDGMLDYRDADDDGDGVATLVEVTDGANYTHDVDFDDTSNWLDPDADGDGVPDGTEGLADRDDDGMPAYLDNDGDNDGLPGHYERNVTGTAPANNDSTTGVVEYETADNDVIDGMEDFDADTLGNYREYTLGTDPLDNDTDGDGLTDGFENRHRAFDPLAADSDDDGVADGETDRDDDGLTSTEEDEYGTLVDRADTDRDTLLDGREVDLGTDPTTPDTDDDGLDDPAEPPLGTDPLVADTDGDGVLDGNETFETTATDPETGATVDIRGSGNLSASVRVTPKAFFEGVGARAGPTVRITNRSAFENATVSLPVDDAVPESEYDSLAVYTWNGSANDTWTPLETTVENGTARATVEDFSYFTVLDTDEWVNATSLDVGEPIRFNETNVTACTDACEIRNETTAILGGEPSARQIRIEQGDRTLEVVPLSNGQSIERFYDYGAAEINSPLPVAKSDTSRLFLWSGPNGLSLVVVHDKPRDGSGAAVSFEFSGLPGRGSWVVRDDGGDFRRSGGAASPDWTWTRDNTDGGAFRGGLTNTSITIEPKFNEQAYSEPLTSGRLDAWQVLTGRATDPRNESLALDEPITIHVPEAPGDGTDGTAGDSGRLDFSTRLANGTEDVRVVYQTEQTDVNPSASVTVTGPEGARVTRSLSIGTVGTVSEVLDVSSLAAGNASVSLSADGVNLRAQLIARSSFDTDDDGIPDDIEERTWTLPTGPADTFSTDPRDNDTDGDGIPDGEEVEFTREVVDGELRTTPAVVRSNPDAVDSDDDGLTDPEERRGWNTYLATSADQGDRFAEAREGDGNATAVLFEQNVSADPLRADADGDRLDDTRERIAGTNPGVADSDGDGNTDGEEVLDDERGDPTIHDHTAPAVEPISFIANNVQRTSYTISLAVTDQSGFTTVNFYKKGERQRQLTEISETAETYRNLVINVERGAVDSIITGISGFFVPPTMDVETIDVHDTSKRRTIKGPDSFGAAADKYSQLPINPGKNAFVGVMAFSSGVTTVIAETIIGIVNLLTDPLGFVDQIRQFAETVLDNPAILLKLPQLIIQSIQEKQDTRNPFEPAEPENNPFQFGWFTGYLSGQILSSIISSVGKSAAFQKLLQNSRSFQRLIDAVDSAVPDRVPNRIRPGVLRRAGKIDDNLPDTDVRTGTLSARLSRVPEADRGRIVEQFDELDPDALDGVDVDAPTTKAAGLFDAANDPSNARRALEALAETDDEAASVLLRIDDPETQWRFARAYDRSVDGDELATALRRYDELDIGDKRAARGLLKATGDNGVRFLSRADPATVRNVVGSAADGNADYARTVVRRFNRYYRTGDADARVELSDAVRRIDQLEATGNSEAAAVARRLVASDTEGGSRLVNTFDASQLRRLGDEIEAGTVSEAALGRFARDLNERNVIELRETVLENGDSDATTADLARFVGTSDGEASTLVRKLEGQQLIRVVEMDSADRDVVIEAGIRHALNGRDDLASNSLTPADMMELDDSIDLQNARMVAKTADGKPVALVPGTPDSGFDHLQARHFDGTEINSGADQPTTFFPSGAEVPARGGAPAAELPSNLNRDELAPLVREAIERSSASAAGGFRVEFDSPRNGITEMQVNLDGSTVGTAYPRAGPAVKRFNWEAGRWEEWTESGWQRWEAPYETTERLRSPRPIQPDTPRTTALRTPASVVDT